MIFDPEGIDIFSVGIWVTIAIMCVTYIVAEILNGASHR